jgi:organic radical activating enzyme
MSEISTWAGYDLEYITSYDINDVIEKIRSQASDVALYGAGLLGRYAIGALKTRGISVDAICDSDENKLGNEFCGYEISNLANLAKEKPNAYVFVCHTEIGPMLSALASLDFKNVFSCIPLFNNTNRSALQLNEYDLQENSRTAGIDRDIELYNLELMQFLDQQGSEGLKLPVIDIVITEACSMKCKDCANLMQYYLHPERVDFSILFESIEKIMRSVDSVRELRVLGGEPFLIKDIHKVIEKLLSYENGEKVVVYTNATIVPKGKNLTCLNNERVLIEVTNYGSHSRNYDKLLKAFDNEGIFYASKIPQWTDSGRILPYQDRTDTQLKDMFFNCCVNDVFTLLHGKLYHCPFSANAMNLNAVPFDSDDVIDLVEEKEGYQLRKKIEKFYKKKEYLTACSYCNGRDYRTPSIEPAIQTKKPLPIAVTF